MFDTLPVYPRHCIFLILKVKISFLAYDCKIECAPRFCACEYSTPSCYAMGNIKFDSQGEVNSPDSLGRSKGDKARTQVARQPVRRPGIFGW
jgi:hypothetical protein